MPPAPWLDPDRYHGLRATRSFFEGWYYKLVDPAGRRTLAVIPGVFMSRRGDNRFAFVMTVDGASGQVAMERYPMEAFSASPRAFSIQIGPNRFSAQGLTLDLAGATPWRGELVFTDLSPWPVTLRAPGVMGWYAYVPFMECFHGVVSMDHRIEGTLDLGRETIDFTGGRGYTEKDWGRNFPASWVWMQGNHFPETGTSVSASIAIIPFLGTTFGGSIIGLRHEGRLYRFTTYTGARVRALDIEPGRVRVVAEDRRHRLEIEALTGPSARLFAPGAEDMIPRVDECLDAPLSVTLSERGGRVVFAGLSPAGAAEVQGDLPRLQAMLGLGPLA
ncbi:MAG: tocopherol cyclase family protein [Rhodothermales bacterium]|nr:tocopherol cyclase family protein [Rhodothermales bacterium]